jgi:NAD(P)-dependent dehydrogenase (short-subunit alcohol dehydrogenase family)
LEVAPSVADEDDPLASAIGARGIGELGATGVSAAIANAVWHATGKRLRKLPIRASDIVAGRPKRLHTARGTKVRAWAASPALPVRRVCQPEDIADAIVFLMTNPCLTGHTLRWTTLS